MSDVLVPCTGKGGDVTLNEAVEADRLVFLEKQLMETVRKVCESDHTNLFQAWVISTCNRESPLSRPLQCNSALWHMPESAPQQ